MGRDISRSIKLRYLFILFLLALFAGIQIPKLQSLSEISRLTSDLVFSADFRSQPVSEDVLDMARECGEPGELLGIYWLESDFGRDAAEIPGHAAGAERERWRSADGWAEYAAACRAVWDDVEYFPVAEPSNRSDAAVTFEDSWMFGRSYKGDRGHECLEGHSPGCDGHEYR